MTFNAAITVQAFSSFDLNLRHTTLLRIKRLLYIYIYQYVSALCFCSVSFVLFVLEFYGPVNNEVMSSRSVNSGTVPGQA